MDVKSLGKVRRAMTIGAMMGLSGTVNAAGFALLEQNASGTGNAFAGSAAVAEDAGTVFFNPAGMSLLQGMQFVISAHAINVSSKFSGSGTPLPLVGSGAGGDAGDLAFVPNLYFYTPIGEKLGFGVGVNAPFGLRTEYEDTWLGRFQGIKSELTTVNINPSLAYKVDDKISLGIGLNWQRAEVDLTNAVFLGVLGEGRSRLKADDTGWGWNVGALFQLGSDMRLGVAYRSRINYTLEGDVSTTLAGATLTPFSFSAQADVTLPDSATISVVQKFDEKWELLGDLMWTHWSLVDQVRILNRSNGSNLDTLLLNFDDAWRVAIGVNYHQDEHWTFKGGIAYDQSPVDNANRTVRIPDTDRLWLAVGAKYRFSKNSAIDIGYAHLFGRDGSINQTRSLLPPPASAPSTTVRGDYKASIDILSAQVMLAF